ncbi:MAG: CorA family divalent cation transporter, partial [bacterium]
MPKKQKYASKVGLPPGALVYVGEPRTGATKISVMDFSAHHFDEVTVKSIAECKVCGNENSTTWVDVDSIHNVDIIEQLGEFFKIDQLLLEDVLNTQHRPTFEEHDNYLYLSLKAFYKTEEKSQPVIQ